MLFKTALPKSKLGNHFYVVPSRRTYVMIDNTDKTRVVFYGTDKPTKKIERLLTKTGKTVVAGGPVQGPVQGEGLLGDAYRWVKNKVVSVTNTFVDKLLATSPERLKAFIRQHGQEKIHSLTVVRVPIQSTIKSIINIISNGKLAENQKRLGYDDIFHLFVWINGKYQLERNHLIEVKHITHLQPQSTTMRVALPRTQNTSQLTIAEFLANCLRKEGTAMFRYHPGQSNCQYFVKSLLDSNGLNTPDLNAFVMQDAQGLLKGIDGLHRITDLAAVGHRLLGGQYAS